MATTFPAEPLRWALDHAERDGLRGEAALVRALELALAEGGPSGEALVHAVREAVSAPKTGFVVAEQDLLSARRAVVKLEGFSPRERIERIAKSRRTYRGVAIGTALLERAISALPADGPSSGSWAESALRAVRWTSASEPWEVAHVFALEARAWAIWANSARIACDLPLAEKRLEQAIRTLESQGVTELATRAEVLEIAASLQRARRKTTEAVENLRWCAAVWEVLGRTPERARVLATLVMTLQVAGEPQQALRTCEEGLALAVELEHRRLEWHFKHNEFEIRYDLEQVDRARQVAEAVRQLAEPYSDAFTRARIEWLEGRMAILETRPTEAVPRLLTAQSAFLADCNPYAAALVSIDLAILHLEAGRYAEAAELATAMAATFDALGIQREAWAACRLFADACERQRASVALAKNLARYLDQARQDPEYGFPASALFG